MSSDSLFYLTDSPKIARDALYYPLTQRNLINNLGIECSKLLSKKLKQSNYQLLLVIVTVHVKLVLHICGLHPVNLWVTCAQCE